MIIKEKVNTVKLTIIKNSNDGDISDKIPEYLPKKNFSGIIIGGSGSGKSTLTAGLLLSKKYGYRHAFDTVFYFNASLNTLDDKFLSLLPEERTFDSLDELPEIMEEINDPSNDFGKTLFVFDDLITQINKDKEILALIKRLSLNRRHWAGTSGVSLILISQKYTLINTALRQNSDWVIMFNKTKKEVETLYEDLLTEYDRDEYLKIIRHIFFGEDKDKRNFLMLNRQNNKIYKNFNELILERN